MTTPTVSIIIRTVNDRSALLKNAFTSLLNQTYQNFEIIVVQDGGDSARTVINQLSESDKPKITFIACDKIGRSKAGNTGLAKATGDYIGFLDDDDELLPDHVKLLTTAFESYQDAAAICAQAWETNIKPQDRRVLSGEHVPKRKVGRKSFSKLALMYKNYLPIQSILFSRKLYDELGGFDENLNTLEDWDLWLRYSASHNFHAILDVTSIYRAPHDRNLRIMRVQEHQENMSYIRKKQQGMRLIVSGDEVLEEYNKLAVRNFLGGRLLQWWLYFQDIRFRIFGEPISWK